MTRVARLPLAVLLATALGLPPAAAAGSSVAIAGVTVANGRVTVSGTLVLGDEARARVSVMTDPAGYIVPGGVQVAIAAAGTPEGAIDWSSAVSPNVQPNGSFGGTFTPSEPLLPGAEYQVVARSCSGTTDAPACVSATRTFTA